MNIYRAYIVATAVPLLRTPVYWVPLVVFPMLLYTFFGVAPSQQNPELAAVLLASWSAFAVIGIGFFQFGVSIAQSRESKWEDYARTLPIGTAPKLVAQVVTAMLFLVIALTFLWTLSRFTTAIDLSVSQYANLFLALLVGVIPFVLMGAALGYLVPARGAVPIANLLYLPLAFFGGLWTPPSALPGFVATVSPFTPTRHLGELVWAAVQDRSPPITSLYVLAAFAAVSAIIAVVMWRKDETVRTR
jgi:ABC-2 type transport system permease protein